MNRGRRRSDPQTRKVSSEDSGACTRIFSTNQLRRREILGLRTRPSLEISPEKPRRTLSPSHDVWYSSTTAKSINSASPCRGSPPWIGTQPIRRLDPSVSSEIHQRASLSRMTMAWDAESEIGTRILAFPWIHQRRQRMRDYRCHPRVKRTTLGERNSFIESSSGTNESLKETLQSNGHSPGK